MVVCINEKIYRDVSAIGMSEEKIGRIPNGENTKVFSPEKVSSREIKGARLSSDLYLVVFSGRLVRQKGIDVLLRAWALFVKEHPESLLLILGTDALQQEGVERAAKRFVVERGLSKHVMFVGLVRNVYKFLKMADLYIFPSRDGEGLSNALIEAMACGLPVIASDVWGNRSVLTHGVNGILFPTGDHVALASHIRELHGNSAKAETLGGEARNAILRRYSIESIADKYASIYSSIVLRGRD